MPSVIPIGSIIDHRQREKGVLVYPVYSRRSLGLSVGINLFPGGKRCSFDCPYCEVFPFSGTAEFSPEQMEEDLRCVIRSALERDEPVRDISFSGNGEPAQSPAFPEALKRAGRVRTELVPGAKLVVITNGSFLLEEGLFSLLVNAAAGPLALDIWLKLDAGTTGWYKKINCSALPFEKIVCKLKQFAAAAPLTIQTMLCAVDGEGPPGEDAQAWEGLIAELAAIAGETGGKGGGIRLIQIYGKARPAPEDPKALALPEAYLEERARSLRLALAGAVAAPPPVKVYP